MTSQSATPDSGVHLVIADVDGTLVTQDKVLTPRAIAAVKSLRDAGILFGITSGRPPLGMKMIVEALQLTEPIAGFNGGVVVNPDYTTVFEHLLPADVAAKAVQLVMKNGLDVFLYSDSEWFVRDPKAPHVAIEQRTVQFSPTVVHDFDSLMGHVVKVVGVSDNPEAMTRGEKDVQQWSAGRVSAALSQPYYLDITHPDANKGQVVLMFSKLCNIPPSQVATIGDMPNDVLMFEKSGVSIAMGNASPQVQRSATFVTASNQEDGFAKAMERLLKSGPAL